MILEAPAGNGQIWLTDDYAVRRPDPRDPDRMEMYELEGAKATLIDEAWNFGKRNERRSAKAAERASPPLPRRQEVWTGKLKPTPGGGVRSGTGCLTPSSGGASRFP